MGFDWQPLILSFQVAAAATVFAFISGTLAASLVSNHCFRGREILEGIFLLPLVLPPIVTGYALLVLMGRQSFIGRWLEQNFDARLLFTPHAAVLAAAVVAFPLMYQSAKAAFLGIEPHLQDAARSLGATPRRVFWTITLPLSRIGLVAGATLCFARALGEFGATIMVAGNIAGKTTTAPAAIYMAAEDGDLRTAGIYAALLALFNVVFVIGFATSTRRKKS